jgi:ABC-type amino acid transport substrate-binding protein
MEIGFAMKARVNLILALLFIALAMVPLFPVLAQDALPDLGGQTIRVATENAYVPFGYVDQETGESIGWNYDAIGEICARLNCVPEYITTSWDGMLAAVGAGEFDVAADGITITEEREEVVDFSIGYIAVEQVVLVRADEDRFSSVEEIVANTEIRLGSQTGTTNYTTSIELVGEDRVQTYDNFGILIQSLITGDIDVVLIDNVAGQGYVGENANALKIIGEPVTSDELGFAFTQDSDLVEPFNQALTSMMNDGSLDLINMRWFPPVLPDLGGRTVTVALENAYIPFNFINQETGEPEGWDYDALAEICARLNCVPEYITVSWDGMIVAVSNGEYDMAADGITITEERRELVDFSIGYISVDQVLLVRADEDRFTSVDDFITNENLRIGSQVGTTNYDVALELVGEDRVQSYDTFGVTVQSLVAGDVDAVVIDNVAGQGYVGENADLLRIIDTPLTSDALGFVFPKGSDLVTAFDAALVSMMNDGTLAEINATWFPSS